MNNKQFNKFVNDLGVLFCGKHFNSKQRDEMMSTIIEPTFVVRWFE